MYKSGIAISLWSSFTILVLFLLYSKFTSPENPVFLTPFLNDLANAILISFFICIALLVYGTLKTIFAQKSVENGNILDFLRTRVFAVRRFRLIFISSSILYFIFFGFLTNIFVLFNANGTVFSLIPQINPMNSNHNHSAHDNHTSPNGESIAQDTGNADQSNSIRTHHGHSQNHERIADANIGTSDPVISSKTNYPDISFVICCNHFGYVPMVTIYATSNLSVLLIPLNFFLGVVISMLVGITVTLNVYALKRINITFKGLSKGRIFSGLGLTTGLLVGCPTCAGSLLYSIIGFSSLVTFSSLGLYQMFFLAISIPFLIVSITILAKFMHNSECSFDRMKRMR
jgi:hypothetical protein